MNPVIEMLAVQFHREYRAAEKALGGTSTSSRLGIFKHDHGWAGCHRQKYFLHRAAMLVKRSEVVNSETLGEAECALAASVLLRRLSVQGKINIQSRGTDRFSRTVGDMQ